MNKQEKMVIMKAATLGLIKRIEREEMRFLRRELINFHLQNSRHNIESNPFRLRDIKFLTRNSEVYHYGHELRAYK